MHFRMADERRDLHLEGLWLIILLIIFYFFTELCSFHLERMVSQLVDKL